MNSLKLIKYNFDKIDYIKYLFIFFTIYIFIYKLDNIFTFRQILVLSIAILLTFYFMNSNLNNNLDKYKNIYNITKKLNINKYKYIQNEIEILDSLYKLLYLRSLNSYSYKNVVLNTEKFLRNYYKIMNISNSYPKNFLYNNLIVFKKKILNELMSCSISFQINKELTRDENILYTKNEIIEEISKFDQIINGYISNAKNKINTDWNNGETDIYSSSINDLYPEINDLTDNNFSPHFSIY